MATTMWTTPDSNAPVDRSARGARGATVLTLLAFVFTLEAIPASGGEATLYRDAWGVPHVWADTEAAGYYAMGYAQAEDRLEDIYLAIREATGRMAEVKGKAALENDYLMRLFHNDTLHATYLETAPAHVQDAIRSFAAGIRAYAAEHPDEHWDRVIETNLSAQFVLAREFGREMVARGSGKIVFLASLLTYQGGINVPGYAASKGGIGQLTMALANEWAGRGVNVNAIAPGYVVTDNTEALRNDPVRREQILARIPAGRWARPEDVQGAALFLCSEAAAYVHGTVLRVDGGWLGR